MVADHEKKAWPCAKCGLQRSNFAPHVHGVQNDDAALWIERPVFKVIGDVDG